MNTVLVLAGLLCSLAAPGLALDFDDWEAQLDAAQVVPPTSSSGTGVVQITYSFDDVGDPRPCSFGVTYTGLSGPATGVSIKWGRNGENGPLAFTVVSSTFASPLYGNLDIPRSILGYLGGDTLYVVVNTEAYPDGEVRGHFVNVTPPAVERTSWGAVRGSYR
jgi:hypothetical protein